MCIFTPAEAQLAWVWGGRTHGAQPACHPSRPFLSCSRPPGTFSGDRQHQPAIPVGCPPPPLCRRSLGGPGSCTGLCCSAAMEGPPEKQPFFGAVGDNRSLNPLAHEAQVDFSPRLIRRYRLDSSLGRCLGVPEYAKPFVQSSQGHIHAHSRSLALSIYPSIPIYISLTTSTEHPSPLRRRSLFDQSTRTSTAVPHMLAVMNWQGQSR